MILRILATITGNELAFKRLLSKFLWTAIDLILDALRVTTSHDFADLRGRQGSSRPRMVLLSPVGVGKLGYPVNPLAPNQVDMRLPHDTDGGRDTEKMWYRGMVDVTAIKNSKKALGSRRGEKNVYPMAQRPTNAQRIHRYHCSRKVKCMAIAKCGRENGGCAHTPCSLNSIIIGENRGVGHLDMHAYILAGHRAGGAWTVDRARDVIELRRGGILGKGTENALDDEGHRGLAIALEPPLPFSTGYVVTAENEEALIEVADRIARVGSTTLRLTLISLMSAQRNIYLFRGGLGGIISLTSCTCRCKGRWESVGHDEGACWGCLRNGA